MKIRDILAFALLLLPLPAQAQVLNEDAAANILSPGTANPYGAADPYTRKPALTPPQMIAMLYHKFAGILPDFRAWARTDAAYIDAPDFDKLSVLERKAQEMQDTFSLITPQEPLIHEYPVVLSEYSFSSKGYFIENVRQDTFFPVSYQGVHYAVVPNNVIEKQWLPVDDLATAKAIDDLRRQSVDGRTATLTFYLAPVFAREGSTVTVEGIVYKLLSADIKALAFFDKDGAPVWRRSTQEESPSAENSLMTLYR